MKCPKCHYLSFEPSPRCRNCGFDLGIADADLPIRPADQPEAPLADLDLKPRRRASTRRAPKTLGLIHPAREAAAGAGGPAAAAVMELPEEPLPVPAPLPAPMPPPASVRAAAPAPSPTPGELPLFVKGLASRPATPPLAVRRAVPELVRSKLAPSAPPTPPRRPGSFETDLIEDLERVEAEEAARAQARAKHEARLAREALGEAPWQARVAALAADWAILAAISGLVLWASLRVSGARPSDLGLPALVPLLTFLLLVDFAYFVLFTAGNGQTPGKMALNIRVVDAGAPAAERPPSVRQAQYRTLLAVPDRFTRTRTVRG